LALSQGPARFDLWLAVLRTHISGRAFQDEHFRVNMAATEKLSEDVLKQLRALSHKMSNALEVIIQAQYLLQQSELSPEDEKWAAMISKAAAEAIEANTEIRDIIRALSATNAESAALNAARNLNLQNANLQNTNLQKRESAKR
jgi:hypothetical protein